MPPSRPSRRPQSTKEPDIGKKATPQPDSQPGAVAATDTEPVINAIVRLEVAQSLPEVDVDAPLEPVEHAEGAIERFIASDTDRRVMAIVGFAGGLAAQAVEAPAEA